MDAREAWEHNQQAAVKRLELDLARALGELDLLVRYAENIKESLERVRSKTYPEDRVSGVSE